MDNFEKDDVHCNVRIKNRKNYITIEKLIEEIKKVEEEEWIRQYC
jgi:hypothetical protein